MLFPKKVIGRKRSLVANCDFCIPPGWENKMIELPVSEKMITSLAFSTRCTSVSGRWTDGRDQDYGNTTATIITVYKWYRVQAALNAISKQSLLLQLRRDAVCVKVFYDVWYPLMLLMLAYASRDVWRHQVSPIEQSRAVTADRIPHMTPQSTMCDRREFRRGGSGWGHWPSDADPILCDRPCSDHGCSVTDLADALLMSSKVSIHDCAKTWGFLTVFRVYDGLCYHIQLIIIIRSSSNQQQQHDALATANNTLHEWASMSAWPQGTELGVADYMVKPSYLRSNFISSPVTSGK